MNRITAFLKKEAVLSVAFVLALISVLFVPPSASYIDYIDFHSLGLLLCLMLAVGGFQKQGLFSVAGNALLRKATSFRQIACILVLLPFFTSMLITNDVALITFVPFAVRILIQCGQRAKLCAVIVLQTIAANLGSMLTPLGNPQNLYLYSQSGMNILDFLLLMLPYTGLSLLLLLVFLLFLPKTVSDSGENAADQTLSAKGMIIPVILFTTSLLAVIGLIEWYYALALVVILLLIFDRSLFRKADWLLLLTFICFFVFVGNVSSIPAVNDFLKGIIADRETVTAVLSSQVISNVPAAVLLSGFTSKWSALIVGVNVGGLGTLIASMASLISFRFYSAEEPKGKLRYLGIFTLYNLIFLVPLLLLSFLLF